jgi:riboflavin transporter FmnP
MGGYAMSTKTKRMVIIGMLSAVAYLVMLARIPVVLFLKYEAKDVVVTMGGFMLGPVAAMAISVVVSLLEMFTVSDTGVIGLVMNILSSFAFAVTASVVYTRKRSVAGAAVGLVCGIVTTTIVMLLWNYLITPLYMNTSRADIAAMLVPAFLPFNLIKTSLNAALVVFLYKPVVMGLRGINMLEKTSSPDGEPQPKTTAVALYIAGVVLACTCILAILVKNGII